MPSVYEGGDHIWSIKQRAKEIDKTKLVLSGLNPLEMVKTYIKHIFLVTTSKNLAQVYILAGIVYALFFILFQKHLLRFYRYLMTKKGLKLNGLRDYDYGKRGWKRKIFEGFTYLVCALYLSITIPYTKMEDSHTWLCWWSWMGQLAFICMSVHTKWRRLRRFAIGWYLYIAFGLLNTANASYFYYSLFNYQWDYLAIHIIPPVYVIFWLVCNIREFDDGINPLAGNPIVTGILLNSQLILVTLWRHWNNPNVVYRKYQMKNLYTYMGLGPGLCNFILVLFLCACRIIWSRIYLPDDVKQIEEEEKTSDGAASKKDL